MASPPGSDGGGGGGSGSDQADHPDHVQSAPPHVTSFTLDTTSAVDPGPLSAPPAVQNTTPADPDNTSATTVVITASPNPPTTIMQNAVTQAPSQTGTAQATASTSAADATRASRLPSFPKGDPPTGPASEETCNNLHGRPAASDGHSSAPMMLNGSYPLRRRDVADGPPLPDSSMPSSNSSLSGGLGQNSATSGKDQVTNPEPITDRNPTAFFAKETHTIKQNVCAKFPHVAAADRADQVLPACDEYYFGDVPKWANVLPWEFPYGDRHTEEAFLRSQFSDRDMEAWGGAGGEGNGYRFLKNVWIHIARYNAHYKIPRMAEKWWAEDDHASLPKDVESVNMFKRPDLQPEAFFTNGEIDTYGRKLSCETMLYICGQIKNYVEVLDGEQQQPTAEHDQPTLDLTQASNQSASLMGPVSSSAGHAMHRAVNSSNPGSLSITGQDQAAQRMMYHAPGPTDAMLYHSIPVQNQYVAPGSMHIDAQGVAHQNYGMYQPPATHFGSNSHVTAVHLNNAHLLPPSQGLAYASMPPSFETPSLNAPSVIDRNSQPRGHRTFSSGEHSRAGYESQNRRSGCRGGRGARRNSARGGSQYYHAPRGSRDGSSSYVHQPPAPYRSHRQSYDAHSRDMSGNGYMRGARPQLAYENMTPPAGQMAPMLHDTAANSSRHQQSGIVQRGALHTSAPPHRPEPQQRCSLYDPYGDDQRDDIVTRVSIGKDCKWARTLVVLSLGLSADIGDIMRNFELAGAHIHDVQRRGAGEFPVYFIDFKSHDDARIALTAYHAGTIDNTMRLEVARSLWDLDNFDRSAGSFGTHPRGAVSQSARGSQGTCSETQPPAVEYGHRLMYVSQSMMDAQLSGWQESTLQGRQTDSSTGNNSNEQDQSLQAPATQQTPTKMPQHSNAADIGSALPQSKGATGSKKNIKKKSAGRACKQAAVVDQPVAPISTQEAVIETPVQAMAAPPSKAVDEFPPSYLETLPKSSKGKEVDTTIHTEYAPSMALRQDSLRIESNVAIPPTPAPVSSTERHSATTPAARKSDAVRGTVQHLPASKVDIMPSNAASTGASGNAQHMANAASRDVSADDSESKVRSSSEPAPQKPKLVIDTLQKTNVSSVPAVVSADAVGASSKVSPVSQRSEVTAKQESNGSSNGTVLATKRRIISESSVAQTPTEAYHTAPNTPQKDEPIPDPDDATRDEDQRESADSTEPTKATDGMLSSKAWQQTDTIQGKFFEKSKGPSQTESLSMFGGKKSKKPKKTKPIKGASKKAKARLLDNPLESSASHLPSSVQPESIAEDTSNTETLADSSGAGTGQGGRSSSRVGSHSGEVLGTLHALTRDASQPPQEYTEALSVSEDLTGQVTLERTPLTTERFLDTGVVSAGEPYNPSIASEGGDNEAARGIGQHATDTGTVLSKSQRERQKKKEQAKRKEVAEEAEKAKRLAAAKSEEARELEEANSELQARMERIRAQPEVIKGSCNPEFERSTAKFATGEDMLDGGTRLPQSSITLSTTGRIPTFFDVVDYTSYLLHHAARSTPFLLAISSANTMDLGGMHMITDSEGENIVLDRRLPALAVPGSGWDVVLNFTKLDDGMLAIRLFRARDEYMDRWHGGEFYLQGLGVIFMPGNREGHRYMLPSILYGT